MYFYKYRVKFYDDVDNVTKMAEGLTADESYIEAMRNVTRFYSDGDIDVVTLEIATDILGDAAEDVYEISNERIKRGDKA